MDQPGTTFSVQNDEELWPGAKDEYASKRADGSIKDHPGERMFSARRKQREDQNHDHAEGRAGEKETGFNQRND